MLFPENATTAPIEPYLNAHYWGGHMLGLGDVQGNVLDTPPATRADNRFAHNSLQENMPLDFSAPLRSYYRNETFHPEEFNPGTVVIYRLEYLTGKPFDSGTNAIMTYEPRPKLRTEVLHRIEDKDNVLIAQGRGVGYMSAVMLGVVPYDNKVGYTLTTSSGRVERRDGVTKATGRMLRLDGPLTVGKTIHEQLQKDGVGDGREVLGRINVLHVVGEGIAERRKANNSIFRGPLNNVADNLG